MNKPIQLFTSKSSVDVNQLIAEDGWQCRYCGKFLTADLMTVDHVLPTSRGGSDKPSNVVLCCRECNAQKGDMNLEEYTHYMNVRTFIERVEGWGITLNQAFVLRVPRYTSVSEFILPAMALGSEFLHLEYKPTLIAQGYEVVRMSVQHGQEDVAFISGPLLRYYQWKRLSSDQ